jgi:hypothetical protein
MLRDTRARARPRRRFWLGANDGDVGGASASNGVACATRRSPHPVLRYLAPPLRSTSSAAAEAALFARFSATSGRSDFSFALIVGYGLRPSRQPPGHDWRGRRWRSPGSRAKGFGACQGLRRRGVGMPSVGRRTSAPRTCLTPLNTSPTPSPMNASRLPSRAARASLGDSAVRYSFTVTDFHRLPFAGLPAHPSTTSLPDIASRARYAGSPPKSNIYGAATCGFCGVS